MPLGEAKSGAKFPIQADFLVQPGREAINYEAKWNHWLIDEVTALCKDAINYFKNHESWRYQFLPVFEFTKSKGSEPYEKLFGPKLINPIEKFIEENDCIPTSDGSWAKPRQVVRLNEDQQASEDLITMGVLQLDEIAPVMGGKPDLKLVAPNVREPHSEPITKVDRHNLLDNRDFLEKKCKEPDADSRFRRLYIWLHTHSRWTKSKKGNVYQEGYWTNKIVLTADGQLSEGRNVWFIDFEPSDPILKDLSETLQKSRPVLHPGILGGAKDEDERKAIKGFLIGLTGVQKLDSKTVCKDALLPKILTNEPKPSPDDLVRYTVYCQQILGDEVGKGLEFWVLTKQGDIRSAKEVFFSKEFKPEQDWETHQQYVSGLSFISPRYIEGKTNDEELKAWRQFFKAGGVKDAPVNGVEEFAMKYAIENLNAKYRKVTPVEKRNFGYDIEVETQTGDKICIEVKGQSHAQDVELTGNEVEAADVHKDLFCLCVVSDIPETPAMHMVENPAAPGVGKKDKLTIPINIWKAKKWS